ncbi:MAG TPA: glycoside hydrolase family 30 beta sandwich domain-containing protein [Chryseosolibacter sp.]
MCAACSTVETGTNSEQTSGTIEAYVTTGDKTSLFQKSATPLSFTEPGESSVPVLQIDSTQQYQSIDGFGYALTGGSADLINQKLTESQKNDLLKELFSTDGNSIGISYLRVSIGASDLDDHVFTYNDLPAGQTDPELKNFTLKEDQENLIPILKRILAINPNIKIMGSPWTAPVWMKTNNLPKGGSLKPEFYPAYAQYFVKYIQGMAAEGIAIDAITVQNEPENPNNTPSLVMTADQQRDFVKGHLGPAFEKAHIKTKIVLFDHNCDHPEYPITIMNDAEAKKYVDGSAFHLYLGQIDAMSKVHDAHPDKNLYFTEQWTWSKGEFAGDLRWHVKNLIVGATRNWSRNVLEWNLAADQNFDPHTDDGGCSECMGALTIGNTVTRNVSYYIIAHASKFVRPGSVRIGSTIVDGLHNVAFLTPDGKKVLIVVNDNDAQKTFSFNYKGKVCTPTTLQGGGVATYVW